MSDIEDDVVFRASLRKPIKQYTLIDMAYLSALRAQAAEAETLRATVAAYKLNEKIRDNDLSDILAGDRTIIERQARQLEYMKHILVNEFGCAPAVVAAWLAANAPAQPAPSWDCPRCDNRQIGAAFSDCPNCGASRMPAQTKAEQEKDV